jgi:hypothetical protein
MQRLVERSHLLPVLLCHLNDPALELRVRANIKSYFRTWSGILHAQKLFLPDRQPDYLATTFDLYRLQPD